MAADTSSGDLEKEAADLRSLANRYRAWAELTDNAHDKEQRLDFARAFKERARKLLNPRLSAAETLIGIVPVASGDRLTQHREIGGVKRKVAARLTIIGRNRFGMAERSLFT